MKQSIRNILIAILSLVTFIGISSFILLNLEEINDATNNNPECLEQESTSQPLTSTGDFLGFYAELVFLGVSFPIDVVSFSAFSGGSANLQGPWETFNYTISNQFTPTNTSAYNPQQKELVCLISDEQQLLEYEDFGMYAPNPLNVSPVTATAPVFLNGTYYAIEIEEGGSATVPLYEADIVSFDYQTATFHSNLHLQYSASLNTSEFVNYHMSSAANRIDELYFLCATNLVIVTSFDIFNPAYCWIDLVPNNTANNYYSFAGIEYRNPGELMAIRNHWVNGNNTATELVQIDFDASTCTVSNISVLYDLKNNIIPYPNNLIVNLEYHSTTYDPCNQLYFISTVYSDDFDSRLIEIDIQNQTHAEQTLPYYLFGIEWKHKPCPCVANFNVTQLDNCGSFSFANTSSGSTPMTCQWDFDDPSSGVNNSSNQCQEVHQFSACGTYNVRLTINANGCIETSYQQVVVTDITPPVALCKNNVVLLLNANCIANVSPTDIDAGSFDDCSIALYDVTPHSFSQCGTFPVTLTVKDWCGNTGVCNTIMQVIDNSPPVINCLPDIYLSTNDPSCKMIVNSLQVITADNCGIPMLTYTVNGDTQHSGVGDASGLLFNQGISFVTYTATDNCGNATQCTIKVVVSCICTCPNNLVQNPGFRLGAVSGFLGTTGQSNNWLPGLHSNNNDATLIQPLGSCDSYSARVYVHNFVPPSSYGSSFYQYGFTFSPTKHYKVSFSGETDYANFQFVFTATSSPLSTTFNPYNCTNCETIGVSSPVPTSAWATYTLPLWTPSFNWDVLFIHGRLINPSWIFRFIDNICIEEVFYFCCSDQEAFIDNSNNTVGVRADEAEEEAVIDIGNLLECNRIALIEWGDGSDTTGPFEANIQLRHQYPDSNKYEIKVTVQELDSSDQVCFETIVSDSAQVKMYTTKYIGVESESSYKTNTGITKWEHDFISRDKGGRINPASSKYNLECALLKPISFPDPVMDVLDEAGDPVSTDAGEIISFVFDDAIAEKVELLSPAPTGYSWKGYRSNLLTPTASVTSVDFPFSVSFTWMNLPTGSQDFSGYMWISDNKDELYGENILDGFGFFPPATFDSTTAIKWEPSLQNIHLHPNPAQNIITLKWSELNTSDLSMEMIDCFGRMVLKKNLESDILQSTIDVSMLEEGLYFIKILRENSPGRILKFVKSN